jgi:hypothetical protein
MPHFSTFSQNMQCPIRNPLNPYPAPVENHESRSRRKAENDPPAERIESTMGVRSREHAFTP